jgi:SNF2 family DNA or RNA helicase
MLIMDEISKLKNAQAKRHKALMKFVNAFPYRMGLTATPASNGYKDLFGQYLALDNGIRLGFKEQYFKDKFFNKTGYMGYDIKLKSGSEKSIQASIADITLQMNAEDYLKLPPVTYNDIIVELPFKAREQYEQMEKELFLQFDNGDVAEITNMAALSNKCLQVANGAAYLYSGEKQWSHVHDSKMDALEDIVEASGHNPLLVLNQYQHDRERILKKFPQAVTLKGGMSAKKLADTIAAWNRGEIEMLVGHAASMGHGLNLQGAAGAMIIWFGLPWSLELYLQANARVHRQGVTHHVVINRILAHNTVDQAVSIALAGKAQTENDMRNAVAQYRSQKLLHQI